MKIAAIIALVLILIVMGIEILRFAREGSALQKDAAAAEGRLSKARAEAATLKTNLNYFGKPENLEKEMRARFNYRGEGEKLLILVPMQSSSASSTP